MALTANTNGTIPVLPDAELGGQPEITETVTALQSITGATGSTLPAYPGEDTRPTSEKELRAWYAYGAAEPYVVVAIATFIPLTLEALARENGHLLGHPEIPCTPKALPIPVPPRSLTPDTNQCVVYLFGIRMASSSFAMYTFSISVLLQSLVIVSMSGAADHGKLRRG
ncbi:autophagy-related protein 22 [Ceratobasidium sp. AG-Ba]|nr:autophagy-related protein 22 [Ceratobasidium sp. AG-Ba]